MLKISKGSNAYKLLETIAVCGDYPVSKLGLLGNAQAFRNVLNKMSVVQDYENTETTEKVFGIKVLTVIGKQKHRTVRLLPSVTRIVKWVSDNADISPFLKQCGSKRYIGRRHRVAVGAVMFRNAGIEYRPYMLPNLQNDKIKQVIPETPCFYMSDALKSVGDKDVNILRYSRITGMFYNGEEGYAVYNALDESMLWFRFEELKARENMSSLSRFNGISEPVSKAILFGNSYEVALKMLNGYEKRGKKRFEIDGVYKKVYFIPVNEFGYMVLKYFAVPGAEEMIIAGLFPDDCHTDIYSRYDHICGPERTISFLTGDVARLKWFKEQMSYTVNADKKFRIICFREQVDFVKSYLNGKAEIKTAKTEDVENLLGISGD